MTTYEIKNWAGAMSGNSVTRTPLIFITPDTKLMDSLRQNNFLVRCQISGTGSVYDGHVMTGIVNKSGVVPNCRPNFFAKTGLYVINLQSNWCGYPSSNGTVKISDLN